MFVSVIMMIASLCNGLTNTPLTKMNHMIWAKHSHDTCIYNLNRCSRKKLKGHYIGWSNERKDEAVSLCILEMEMYKKKSEK